MENSINVPLIESCTVETYNYDHYWTGREDFHAYNPGVRFRRKFLFQAVKKYSPRSVLEVGCGTGVWLSQLKKKLPDADFLGCDISREVIEKNRLAFSNLQFQTLDIEKEHLNSRFDLIIFSEVIEHLNLREEAISNLSKMLNAGGVVLVTCPAGKVFKTEQMFGHVSHPTRKELDDLAEIAGLKVAEYYRWGFPFYTLTKMASNLNAKWTMEQFGNRRYGFFQKLVSLSLYYLNFLNIKSENVGPQVVMVLSKG